MTESLRRCPPLLPNRKVEMSGAQGSPGQHEQRARLSPGVQRNLPPSPQESGCFSSQVFLHKIDAGQVGRWAPSPSSRFPFSSPHLPPLPFLLPSLLLRSRAPLFLFPSSRAEAGQIERSPLFLPWASVLSRDVALALGKGFWRQWNKCSAHHHLKGGDS